MLYVLDIMPNETEAMLTQLGKTLSFNGVNIPNIIVKDRMDIRHMRNCGSFISNDVAVKYEEGNIIIDKAEDCNRHLPTRATLLVSSVRVKGIAGMAKIEGINPSLKDMDLIHPSVFIPLGSSGKYHFAMVIADEFDISFKDNGTYHVDVSCMRYTEV